MLGLATLCYYNLIPPKVNNASNHRDIKGSCKTSQKRTDGLTSRFRQRIPMQRKRVEEAAMISLTICRNQ
jgi:hypothetical protein